MSEAIINDEIRICYPDGFNVMDDAKNTKYFGSPENRWSLHNEEQHSILSFTWTKPSMVASVLTDAKSVANGVERGLRNSLKGFERTADISVTVCGKKADGFSFEYLTDNEDIAQSGRLITFKAGKRYYLIYLLTRKDNEEQAQAELDTILASAAVK